MLIDSGDWPNDGQTVIDYLDAQDIDRIDHLITTHGHADHIGGHAAIIDHYETERNGIGVVWDSGVTHDLVAYDRYLDSRHYFVCVNGAFLSGFPFTDWIVLLL